MLSDVWLEWYGDMIEFGKRQAGGVGYYHVIDDSNGFSYATCLESHVVHPAYQIIHRYWSASKLVKIQLFNLLCAFWHLV